MGNRARENWRARAVPSIIVQGSKTFLATADPGTTEKQSRTGGLRMIPARPVCKYLLQEVAVVDGKMNKRMIGLLAARAPEVHLERVPEPRRAHGRKWSLQALLGAMLVGLCAARRSLAEVEALTDEMSTAARRKLHLRGRVPDTTMRDLLIQLDPHALRRRIYSQVRAAIRRKAIKADVLPFGVASMDGKVTAIEAWDDELAQRQRHGGAAGGACGLVRTVTSVLISSRAKPVLDACPIAPTTNEDGQFIEALDELLAAYRGQDLFRMVMYDSGACSLRNANAVKERGLKYVFR